MSNFKKFAKEIQRVRASVENGAARCEAITDDGKCGKSCVGYNSHKKAVGPLCEEHLSIVEKEDAASPTQNAIRVFPVELATK